MPKNQEARRENVSHAPSMIPEKLNRTIHQSIGDAEFIYIKVGGGKVDRFCKELK